jgi:hypothetical protein
MAGILGTAAILGVGPALLLPAPGWGGAPVCGPSAAETVVQNRHARVYLGSRQGREAAFGCHRARRRARFLGEPSRLRLVRLAGRYTVVVRTDGAGADQRLAIVDLRRGRVEARSNSAHGEFVKVRLDRTGIAAYTLRIPPVDGGAGTVVVGSSAEGSYAYAPDIVPSVLGLAAISIAYKQGDTFRLAALWETEATDGPLLRVGEVRFTVVHRRSGVWPRLSARLGAHGREMWLGAPTTACLSSSGCSGIEALQVAGAFVAVHDGFHRAGDSGGEIRVYDLARRRRRVLCHTSGLRGGVGSFVLTATGRVACALVDDYADRSTTEIRAENTVLDQGACIDVDSLARRGDRLVWLHDGVERSAPLPN